MNMKQIAILNIHFRLLTTLGVFLHGAYAFIPLGGILFWYPQ